MAKTFKIDAHTRDVLALSKFDSDSVTLPGRLDHKAYQRVAKVLVSAGGKWNRKRGCHVFERDPREMLGIATDTSTNLQQSLQFFPTPHDVAKRLVALARVCEGDVVLEPSAGRGRLVDHVRASSKGVSVWAVELDRPMADTLTACGSCAQVVQGDFLKIDPSRLPKFDRVVMNPPFTQGADVLHAEHAVRFLKPGGRLASVVLDGPPQRSRFTHHPLGEGYHSLPSGSFVESGTSVATAIVVLQTQ